MARRTSLGWQGVLTRLCQAAGRAGLAVQGSVGPGGGWWGSLGWGYLSSGRCGQEAGRWKCKPGVGGAFLEMRVLVRLWEKVTEGRWDEGIFVEEVKGLCPACWGLCTWMCQWQEVGRGRSWAWS